MQPRRRRGPSWPGLLLLLLCMAGCTNTRVSSRPADPPLPLPQGGSFRFARAPLAEDPRVSAAAREIDGAVRAALQDALARHGFQPATDAGAQAVRVDFTLRDGLTPNVRRIDSPYDAARAVWPPGPDRDNPGVMGHAMADAAFSREIALSVVLVPPGATRVAWEGTISRSLDQGEPDGEALARVLQRMARRLFEELPAY